MKKAVLLAVSALAVGGAAAISHADAPSQATKDFGAMSADGHRAFQDLRLARLAIFDGDTRQATQLVGDAQSAFARAETEDTVFRQAEPTMREPATRTADDASMTGRPDAPGAAATPIQWVPVDGQYVLDETLAPTPQRTRAVDDANQRLQDGQSAKARDALRVADVNADFVLAVAPMRQTASDIGRASELLRAQDYYNASQAIRQALNGVRFDSLDVNGTPKPSQVAAKSG